MSVEGGAECPLTTTPPSKTALPRCKVRNEIEKELKKKLQLGCVKVWLGVFDRLPRLRGTSDFYGQNIQQFHEKILGHNVAIHGGP